jgi:ATP-binding cassette subfamily F protein 3
LLFVSHDRYFIDSLATKVWVIEDGILIPYYGNYTEYRTRKRPIVLDIPARPVGNEKKAASQPVKPVTSPVRSSNKKTPKVKVRTVEDVERDIEKAELRVKAVEEELAQAALSADAEKLTALSTEYEEAKAHVELLLVEWEQLADTVT